MHEIEMAYERDSVARPPEAARACDLGITSICAGIDTTEIVDTVRHRGPPDIPAASACARSRTEEPARDRRITNSPIAADLEVTPPRRRGTHASARQRPGQCIRRGGCCSAT